MLLKAGADVNAVTKLRGSPLHAAATHATGRAVQALLDRWAGLLLGRRAPSGDGQVLALPSHEHSCAAFVLDG